MRINKRVNHLPANLNVLVWYIGKRTESHRTKSHKTPRTKNHRTKSHNLYFLPWRTKSHNLLIFLYVGRTESHNMYTLIHVCIILLCIVLKTDRNIVSGSFCCFKLYYSLSYQLAVWYMFFSSNRYSKPPRYFRMKNNTRFILISLCQTVKTGFFVLDLQVIV